MLEKMGVFFDSRLDGYEEHQLTCIEGAQNFYPFTASCLPLEPHTSILDLGCGTGAVMTPQSRWNPCTILQKGRKHRFSAARSTENNYVFIRE